jgi:glycosyltransferase involved in cell wall biosynthesis
MRVAVVHDWLYTVGGAERVLNAILQCYPQADLHCLFDLMDESGRQQIGYQRSTTSFLQNMPLLRRNHRVYLPLMPLAIEQLDLRAYDLVISSSSAVAKGVLTGPDQLHVSYVHSPMRYAWDMQSQYLQESRLETGAKSWAARMLLHRMRIWDVRTAAGVDHYIANSRFVARRIRKLYGRQAAVIHPPVRVPQILRRVNKDSFFLTASRLVPYKNMRMIVEAFSTLLPDERLVVAGEGPEAARLRTLAGPNVELVGRVDDAQLRELMGKAAAFVFAAEEDFGIMPVEAQAAGTPVIALGRGGARETVVTDGAAPTGLFFATPDPPAIADAVRRFLAQPGRFRAVDCHANARRFDEDCFARRFRTLVDEAYAGFVAERDWTIESAASAEPRIYAAAE